MLEKIVNNNIYRNIFFFIISIFILLQSPMAPFANAFTGTDESVFIYSAHEILNGHIMYKDIFDHKGPVLYLINLVGLLITGNMTGIWLIEVICLFMTSLFLYKAIHLFYNPFISVLSVLFVLFSLIVPLETGNIVEEYALPFITFSFYIFIKRLKEGNNLNFKDVFKIAIGLFITLLLRPNMIPMWLVFGCVFLIRTIYYKEYRFLLKYISGVCCGALIVLLPFLLYFLLTDSLDDLYYCYWQFNTMYSSISFTDRLKGMYFSTTAMHAGFLLMGTFIILYSLSGKQTREINKITFISLLLLFGVSLILCCGLSGSYFQHYAIPLAPVFLLPAGYIFNKVSTLRIRYINIITLILFLMFTAHYLLHQVYSIKTAYTPASCSNTITEYVRTHTTPEEKISVYGNNAIFYLTTQRGTCSKYLYQFPIVKIDPRIKENYFNDIAQERPAFVIFNKRFKDDLNEFKTKNYNILLEDDHFYLLAPSLSLTE